MQIPEAVRATGSRASGEGTEGSSRQERGQVRGIAAPRRELAVVGDADLREAIDDLSGSAERWLLEQFGTVEAFVHGFGYHNHDHGRIFARAAGQIGSELHEARRVPWETVVLAPYAGWRHDAYQGKGHERRSAEMAAREMRERGIAERYVATVKNIIGGSEVLRIEGFRIVQAADPDNLEQALGADPDFANLGLLEGLYLTLKLGLEQQHLNGLIELPSPTDGRQAEPNRPAAIEFLEFSVGLYDEHRYLLDVSARLFPHREANRDEIARWLALYRADRMTYSQMLDEARRRAS